VLEYHRIPYSERVREDAEYIPLIRAFLRSNTPRYSSKLDIGGKIWHQGKNSKSEISSSFRTTRDTNERERLHTIISREQQQQQKRFVVVVLFAAGESSRYSLDIKERSVGEKIQNWTIKSLGLRSL